MSRPTIRGWCHRADARSLASARGRVWRSTRVGLRVAVSSLSVVVLLASGYGWAQLRHLERGLSRADVIDPPSATAAARGAAGGVAGSAVSADSDAAVAGSADQNILLVGIDGRTDAEGDALPPALLEQLHAGGSGDGGDSTDAMIVLHVPAGAAWATAISIPRDSYVQIAGGWGYHKINAAYTYGKNAAAARLREQELGGSGLERASAQAGARTAIQTVEQLTGLAITHYAAVNLIGFDRISQAVGGVWVCLSAPTHDDYSGTDLPAGWQRLQGPQALAFVRQRHGLPGGDFDRIRRQQDFLAGLAQQVMATGVLVEPGALNNLVAAIRSSVTVDEGFDLLAQAAQLRHLGAGALTFATIPTGTPALATPQDGQAVQVDSDQVRAFVHARTATDPAGDQSGGAPGAAGAREAGLASPLEQGMPLPDAPASATSPGSPTAPVTTASPTCTP